MLERKLATENLFADDTEQDVKDELAAEWETLKLEISSILSVAEAVKVNLPFYTAIFSYFTISILVV